MNEMIQDYSIWTPAEFPPERAGRYLVAQSSKDYKKYRWIRYWDGREWSNASLDKYGPVYAWAELPPLP